MDYWNVVLFIAAITVVGITIIVLLVGYKIWKNLLVTLLISTLISFLFICTLNFFLGDHIDLPWQGATSWYCYLNLDVALMSLLLGGVSTLIIMLGTLIAKNNC